MQRHAGGELQRAADEIAGRRRGEDQSLVAHPFARRQHAGDRAGARLDHRAHRLFDDVGEAALLVARRGIGAAVGFTELKIAVVPVHLANQGVGDVLAGGTWRQQMDGVAHLSDFGKHHRGAGAHQ